MVSLFPSFICSNRQTSEDFLHRNKNRQTNNQQFFLLSQLRTDKHLTDKQTNKHRKTNTRMYIITIALQYKIENKY